MPLTAEQKAFRKSGLGGSDAAELLHGSWLKLFDQKIGGAEAEETLPMYMGSIFEAPMRLVYRRETGAILRGPMMVRHPKHPIAIGNLDDQARRDNTERVVEIKMANWRMLDAWGDGEDEVPERYGTQAQWYMGITGLDLCDVAVLLGGAEFRVYTLKADPELFGMLVELAERFWTDHILTGVAPEPDGSEAAAEILKRWYPKDAGPVLAANEEAERWAEALRIARADADEAEARKTEAENHLRRIIGDAPGIKGDGWKISNKLTKGRPVVDWNAVCFEAGVEPSLVEKYTKRIPYRCFRPTFPKEK